jgi:hypothetical protein
MNAMIFESNYLGTITDSFLKPIQSCQIVRNTLSAVSFCITCKENRTSLYKHFGATEMS